LLRQVLQDVGEIVGVEAFGEIDDFLRTELGEDVGLDVDVEIFRTSPSMSFSTSFHNTSRVLAGDDSSKWAMAGAGRWLSMRRTWTKAPLSRASVRAPRCSRLSSGLSWLGLSITV
jgi:hypothetical protein